MEIHPTLRDLCPPLSEEEYAKLEKSLIWDGCLEPLTTCMGQDGKEYLIDGHHRFQICQNRNIPFETKRIEMHAGMRIPEWIVEHQLGRRNLSTYQRGLLAMKLTEALAGKAKANQQAGGNASENQGYQKSDKPVHVLKEAGKAAGISHDSMHKIQVIQQKGSPEIKAKVLSGKTSLNAGYNQTVNKDPELNKKRDETRVGKLREWLKGEIENYQQKSELPGAPKDECFWTLKAYGVVRKKLGELN